jgi:hypothetical protein
MDSQAEWCTQAETVHNLREPIARKFETFLAGRKFVVFSGVFTNSRHICPLVTQNKRLFWTEKTAVKKLAFEEGGTEMFQGLIKFYCIVPRCLFSTQIHVSWGAFLLIFSAGLASGRVF